jgi:hypothetical protein
MVHMENIPAEIRPLPTPSGYRQLNPAVIPFAPVSPTSRLSRRKRLVIGFCIAAALHVGLILAWWLTPPLRLKASYAPERWVQVLPLVKPETEVKPVEQPVPTAESAAPPGAPPTRKSRHSRDAARSVTRMETPGQ